MSYDVNPGSSTLRRKRSQSLADLQMSFNVTTVNTINSRKFSKSKSEESGYDSDTTRKSGSSPRGSVKSDSFDPSETESSTSERTSVEGERRTEEGRGGERRGEERREKREERREKR